MEDVMQNSDTMKQVAEELTTAAGEYQTLYTELFELVRTGLGASDDGNKAWFGPNASNFLKNFEAKEDDFTNAHKNITGLASNLDGQAQAWATFEG